ncbi:hypothetical protein AG1IA_08262 [Rhizoctonia solani AG-1 IA]|uniref:Uncharacterized protein n=1 Tax=Thanatephorus cucumeris (strain AG1-IA) TaxID=983506 RepID=L8WIH8_THACA|nr:hypothetical protein AG1IA_08262 [Rhizoctonia solani AG-1 IA]
MWMAYLESSLFFSSIVHASRDNIPSAVYVREISPIRRCSSGQRWAPRELMHRKPCELR